MQPKENKGKGRLGIKGLFLAVPNNTLLLTLAAGLSFPTPSSREGLCGWVPVDWQVPDQLGTRTRREERMAMALHPLPLTPDWQSHNTPVALQGKHHTYVHTGPYMLITIKARWGFWLKTSICPTV